MGVDASAIWGVGIYVEDGKEAIINRLLEFNDTDWDCVNPPDPSDDDYESELEEWVSDISWNTLAYTIEGSPRFSTISAGATYGYSDAEGMYLFIVGETLLEMYNNMFKFIEELTKLGITITPDDVQLRGEAFFS